MKPSQALESSSYAASFLPHSSFQVHPAKHPSLFLHLLRSFLPSFLPSSILPCQSPTFHAQTLLRYSIPALYLSLPHLSFCTSERKRERGNRKPLEMPQTGGCGIGRGVDKGESFKRFITQRSHRTALPPRLFYCICRIVGWHFWQPAADVFVCLWQPLGLLGIRFKVEGGNSCSCDVLACQQVWGKGIISSRCSADASDVMGTELRGSGE